MRRLFFLVLLQMVSVSAGCATISKWLGMPYGEPQFAALIPPRASNSLTGSQLASKMSLASLQLREEVILDAAKSGNIPEFLRKLQPVGLVGKRRNGQTVKATIWVMPDYFALGSNANFLRVPMTPMTAQRICDEFGFVLPTRKMVNEIYRESAIKLKPSPMKAGDAMISIKYFQQHNSTIEQQLQGRGRGRIIAGHKKDIVNTALLAARPLQVAIYGWHRGIGDPIQPLSLVHINIYADYSHGVRLVRDVMVVDGKKMTVKQVLKDPDLYSLLSDEGPIYSQRIPTTSHPKSMGKPNS